MAALSPSETCRKVADIIDFDSDRFYMGSWEKQNECGTTACIAGHAAELHGDRINLSSDDSMAISRLNAWVRRQGRNLGLTADAAEMMFHHFLGFWQRHNKNGDNIRYSQVLRHLGKELEDRPDGGLVSYEELERIASEALR